MAIVAYKFCFDWQSIEKMSIKKLDFWNDLAVEILKAEGGKK